MKIAHWSLVALVLCGGLSDAQTRIATSERYKPIVPAGGYAWSDQPRSYWPTTEWLASEPDAAGIDAARLEGALTAAREGGLIRAILMIRGGRIVVEQYMHGGAREQSTEVWSVTKSIVSALIGVAVQQGHIESIDDRVVKYLPDYPELGELTIRHVLMHTTGLEWTEAGDDFVAWIASEDPVTDAAGRERLHEPGEVFLYSSGNSHILTALLAGATGKSPGEYAQENIFDPLGISFTPLREPRHDVTWESYLVRTPHAWKTVRNGIELGAFGLSMTARDMARFGYLYLNKGRWEDRVLIDEAWVARSTWDLVRVSPNFGFGLHWVIARRGGHLAFNADGWGGQIICVVPSLDLVVVIKSEAEEPAAHGYYQVLADLIAAVND